MAVALTIIVDPNDPASRRSLTAAAGTTILKAAHAGGVDITATCGGRGRCTSCRVKFLTGAPPPPTIMDELQLGDDLVREGYRLSCQCVLHEPVEVQLAPPREEHHQTSDLEQLLAAVGLTADDVAPAVVQGLPQALRDDPAGVTVTTFA